METITAILAIIVGLMAGSFFNVLIWRLPRNESIVSPPSHCPACDRPIRPLENVPILSYCFLRGRCAGCGKRISPVYPLVELITAAAAFLIWQVWGHSFSFRLSHDIHVALCCGSLLLMIPVTVIDMRHTIIPDAITLPLLVAAFCSAFLPGDTTPLQALLGILAGGGTLAAIGLFGKIIFRKGDAMGGGDIKLLAAVGALWGAKIALLAIFFGSIYGTAAAAVFILSKRLGSDHRIPFGPFLALGLWTAALGGDAIVSSYMNFIARLAGTF